MRRYYLLLALVVAAIFYFIESRENRSENHADEKRTNHSSREHEISRSERVRPRSLEGIYPNTMHGRGLHILPDGMTMVDSIDLELLDRINESKVSRGGGIVFEEDSEGVEHWLEGWLRIVRSEWLEVGAMSPVGFSDENFFYYARTRSKGFESGWAINKETGFIDRWNVNEKEDPKKRIHFPKE